VTGSGVAAVRGTEDLALPPAAISKRLGELLAADTRRVYILDDDPTGTQTVADVDVVLRPTAASIARFARSSERSVFVLTNSRTLAVAESVRTLTDLRHAILAATRKTGHEPAFILRGDSTLRGHVFAEADVFGADRSVLLFVPAFPEGGRITRNGSQWVRIGRRFVNAADTEFAADDVFGYRSRDLVSWVAEVGGGRRATVVPLQALRMTGPGSVSVALLEAAAGSVDIAEAMTRTDIEAIAVGLLEAEAAGCAVVVRSASTFAAVRVGLAARAIDRVPVEAPGRILVVCGSTTEASTRQLERLAQRGIAIRTFRAADRAVLTAVADDLDSTGIGVLATERVRRPGERDLASGMRVLDGLVAAVAALGDHFEAIVSKGGATSGRIALELGATARVKGQLAPGVALWDLRLEDRRTMPFAVVPGNVGTADTLVGLTRCFAGRTAVRDGHRSHR
jgi:uncharacterized protein YgbK (DUF1537 family)